MLVIVSPPTVAVKGALAAKAEMGSIPSTMTNTRSRESKRFIGKTPFKVAN